MSRCHECHCSIAPPCSGCVTCRVCNPCLDCDETHPESIPCRLRDKFRIRHHDDGYHVPWELDYPLGFDPDGDRGESCATFELAVQAFIEALERRCLDCGKGAVVDTDWGWECKACGQYDVAVGCVRPADSPVAEGIQL